MRTMMTAQVLGRVTASLAAQMRQCLGTHCISLTLRLPRCFEKYKCRPTALLALLALASTQPNESLQPGPAVVAAARVGQLAD